MTEETATETEVLVALGSEFDATLTGEHLDLPLSTFNVDSLDVVEGVLYLEHVFDITFSEEDLATISDEMTLREVAAIVDRLRRGGS